MGEHSRRIFVTKPKEGYPSVHMHNFYYVSLQLEPELLDSISTQIQIINCVASVSRSAYLVKLYCCFIHHWSQDKYHDDIMGRYRG